MEEVQMMLTKTGQKTTEKVMNVVGDMTLEQKRCVLAFFHGVEFGKKLSSSQEKVMEHL